MNRLARLMILTVFALALTLVVRLFSHNGNVPAAISGSVQPPYGDTFVYLPLIFASRPPNTDWPQLGYVAQRTNYSPTQVDPPYCYTWKWYEVPMASRAQPVVADNRLFIGGMDGAMYARNASTGAPLWRFTTGGPIRHTAGVMNNQVVFSSHDGYTYAVEVATGKLVWQTLTGPSVTAPLLDQTRGWVYVASTNGKLTALDLASGAQQWQYDSGAPILTSPSLSTDGQTILVGNEAIYAIAVDAATGAERWRTALPGQSLADRYPVVTTDSVIYRSQPLYFFHWLLQQDGDDVMDLAGAVNSDWAADWSNVKPHILQFLQSNPTMQTFFVLNPVDGGSRGIAPVLYTYGDNDIPNVPVIRNRSAYVTYRARHGIQTDGGSVHVSSQYDAELGKMDLSTLEIVGLRANSPYNNQFRMTSDEPAMLSMGGNILWVDNWERLGGIDVSTGALIHVGAVSNDWPECGAQCGPGTTNPFFPMSGSGPAYPFPSPRVTEGHQRGGVVIANNMLYWRVIEAGLAGISHRAGSACPAPLVWASTSQSQWSTPPRSRSSDLTISAARPLTDYVTLDLTAPIANPPVDLRDQLRTEISTLLQAANGDHLMPYYLERGFSEPFVWPYNVPADKSGLPSISYNSHGNVYWHDPGELLYSMALAYPYLDSTLQAQVKIYVTNEITRYPPLQGLPYNSSQRDWLRKGMPRELYTVPFRSSLNNWPPVDANISALYALWLWSRNTNDWSYAQARWNDGTATALFNARSGVGNMLYYADIAGTIGYARLAQHFNDTAAYNNGVQAAASAMRAGLNFTAYKQRAETAYLDPRDQPTGWYVPVFFGMTPEVGLYLREQLGGQAESYLASKENGNGLRWWYLTRAGAHAEVGETSYVAPIAAWSHFLGHAYIVGDSQATLRPWLDRPWSPGDVYSIQRIVATIHAPQVLY